MREEGQWALSQMNTNSTHFKEENPVEKYQYQGDDESSSKDVKNQVTARIALLEVEGCGAEQGQLQSIQDQI